MCAEIKNKNRVMCLSMVAILMVAVFAPAAEPATQPSTMPAVLVPTTQPALTVAPGGGLLLNFKDASIDAVLDQLSEVAGFIVVKQTKVDGRVTLLSKQPVTPDEMVALLNTVLQKNGYTVVAMGRILKIVSRDKAKKANIPVYTGTDPDKIPNTDDVITQVMPIRFVDAVQLKTDLTPVVGTDADLAANAGSNSLILTDTAANVRRVAQIITSLDQRLADSSSVQVFTLKYASASSAAKLINDLFKDGGSGGGFSSPGGGGGDDRRGRFEFFARMMGGGQSNASSGTRKQIKVTASSDDRTNNLVVSGPPEVLVIIGQIVKQLDSDPSAEQSVFIYNVKNGQAVNLEGVINYLFGTSTGPSRTSASNTNRSTPQSSFGTFGSSSSNSRSSGSSSFGSFGSSSGNPFGSSSSQISSRLSGSSMKTAADLAGQVTAVANADTNSLLIMSNPKNFERIHQILEELDHQVPQVLIKVLVAEVTHDNSQDLGAEFSFMNMRVNGAGAQGVSSKFGLPFASGQGLTYKMLEENAQLTIQALEKANKLNVLSRPYILASDNQLASIMVGQEVPIIIDSRTDSFGNTINSIQYRDVGIILNVTPHINTEGLVIMDVNPQISSLSGETVPISSNASAPVFIMRSAQSRVGINNGQTIVIGGLMQDQNTENISKIPILGDIPLVGALFRQSHVDKTKTELLIFLTPHVASSPETMEHISKAEEKGVKVIPHAVDPKAFDEHLDAMRRPTTQPADQK